MITPSIIRTIISLVGRDNVFTAQEDLITYAYDGTPLYARNPDAVVKPQTKEHISEIVKLANDSRFAIVPRGAGTGLSGGSIPTEGSIVLLMNHWNNILEIDQENLTATVEPGVITSQLHAAVERIGLFYPPDPGSMNISTIGGNVAENSGGLRGLKYGVTKNYVMGLEVVLPNGAIIVCGGKTVKDVAGYNMKDLFVGSEGTLGIFTKIILKLIPKPEISKTMVAYFLSRTEAAQTVSAIIAEKIIPATVEFLDKTTINCVEDFAKLGLPREMDAMLLLEVDGHPSVVEEEAQKIVDVCTKHECANIVVAGNEAEALKLKAARRSAFSALARAKPTTILEDVTVPRSEIARMLGYIEAAAAKYSVKIGTFGHFGDGNLHPTCLTDERNTEELHRVEQAFGEIFEACVKLGGTITGEHGTGIAKRKYLHLVTGEESISAMRAIKNALDPNLVMNPGKVFTV